ncbi:hypothetical protein [Roseibacillus ishigakijimensis]|uniref:Uncharacterized protein n=1 Tax=Roseibacillus ishigakijimensis TaxID=454146 RepID=A0A934RSX5_9BACT|nr:hypothetical protein [Roseibacillus ishigakijimensis]MBK1834459.1 hypothetical protein [Roseibacillus ishigakijimensis]
MKLKSYLCTSLLALTLSSAFGQGTLHGQSTNDPFRSTSKPDNVEKPEENDQMISFCMEIFSLPLADAARLQRKNLPDPEFYQTLVKMVEAEECTQEQLIMLRARSKETATVESVLEEIYPTQYELTTTSDNTSIMPAIATAFETRHTGASIEIQPALKNSNTIELRMASDFVFMVENSQWGSNSHKVEMPTFESQRFTTGITTKDSQSTFVGTLNRPPNSEIDPEGAKKVWLAFVTLNLLE